MGKIKANVLIIFLTIFFFQSCGFYRQLAFNTEKFSDKTKSIQTDDKLSSSDTLLVLKPFGSFIDLKTIQAIRKFNKQNFAAKLSLKYSPFLQNMPPSDCKGYDGFIMPIGIKNNADLGYYHFYGQAIYNIVHNTLDDCFKNRVIKYRYETLTMADSITVCNELSKINEILKDSSVNEINISNILVKVLSRYQANSSLLMDFQVVSFDENVRPNVPLSPPSQYGICRIFLLDIRKEKIIFYNAMAEKSGNHGRLGFEFIRYQLHKIKNIVE